MDGDAVDVPRLVARFKHYVDIHRPPAAEVTAMLGLLASSVGRRVCALSKDELTSHLLDDAYKLKMHAMYAEFATGEFVGEVLPDSAPAAPLRRGAYASPALLPRHPPPPRRDSRLCPEDSAHADAAEPPAVCAPVAVARLA